MSFYLNNQQPAGTYAIAEQGDLGLGLNPIDESALNEEKEDDTDNAENK